MSNTLAMTLKIAAPRSEGVSTPLVISGFSHELADGRRVFRAYVKGEMRDFDTFNDLFAFAEENYSGGITS